MIHAKEAQWTINQAPLYQNGGISQNLKLGLSG